ncbi:MAG: hypothetical protein OSB09_05160 [Planctomycetota bacterium]|nr:hypothetical protein [Planctomycetota bacterium]
MTFFLLQILAICGGSEPLPQPRPVSAFEDSQAWVEDSSSAPDSPLQYPAGVAWWATWEGATEEARRSGKPILLLSAAPQCHGIPGIW